ncbi:MAG: F0F1 ATP synthase subunit delta [Candidatus Saccharimonadales bacterium]
MKLSLQNSVVSRQDLKALILEVRRYGQWAAQNSVKDKVLGKSDLTRPQISLAASQLITQWADGKNLTQKSLDELVTELEDYEATAPYVSITLAAPPPNALKQQLVSWFRDNVRPDILVDFKFNSTMLGGMVVSCGSHVYDWSFKRQILAARDKFPEALRHV